MGLVSAELSFNERRKNLFEATLLFKLYSNCVCVPHSTFPKLHRILSKSSHEIILQLVLTFLRLFFKCTLVFEYVSHVPHDQTMHISDMKCISSALIATFRLTQKLFIFSIKFIHVKSISETFLLLLSR